jgi:hypothetical protein
MRISKQILAVRVLGDVLLLGGEIVFVSNAVLVVAGVPDFSRGLPAGCEGVATLDELGAAGRALIDRRRDEDVDVVEHDGEAV